MNNSYGTMPMQRFGCLIITLLLFTGNAQAETVYVTGELRLGVRNNPTAAERPFTTVVTGDALTVLERKDDYLKIRSKGGTEGWVSKAYVNSDKPASLQLEALQAQYVQRESELKSLRQELSATSEKYDSNEKQLSAVSEENTSLKQQLSRYTGLKYKYAWVYQSATVLALFLLGFYLGVRWYKRRITERLGGMEI